MYDRVRYAKYPAFDRAKERAAIAAAIEEDTALFNMIGKSNGGLDK